MASGFGVSIPPRFNGENYQFWVVKMQFYLKALRLWEFILNDVILHHRKESIFD